MSDCCARNYRIVTDGQIDISPHHFLAPGSLLISLSIQTLRPGSMCRHLRKTSLHGVQPNPMDQRRSLSIPLRFYILNLVVFPEAASIHQTLSSSSSSSNSSNSSINKPLSSNTPLFSNKAHSSRHRHHLRPLHHLHQ